MENLNSTNEQMTKEEALKILSREGVHIKETMTTPKKAGKLPRPVWTVSGRINGVKHHLYDLGGKRWGSSVSFFNGDPTLEIAEKIKAEGRLSFSETQELKIERDERRLEKFEGYSENATARAESRFKTSDNIASFIPMGQPILVGHHSERRHRRDLERIDNNMRKGIEETNKAEYYQDRAGSIRYRLESQKTNLRYLQNRIDENEARLRKLERAKNWYSDFESRKQELEEKILHFKALKAEILEAKKEDGQIIPCAQTISKGDKVKYRGTWYEVVRVNQKTVTVKGWLGIDSFTWKPRFAEISEIKKAA